MDWMKYKDKAWIDVHVNNLKHISEDLKEKIINYNGIFPDVLALPIYFEVPERKDFEEKHPELRDEQAIRAVSYRYMSEAGENSNSLELDESLDFLIENPEFKELYEPVNFHFNKDEDYYVPIEELIEARKKELNS